MGDRQGVLGWEVPEGGEEMTEELIRKGHRLLVAREELERIMLTLADFGIKEGELEIKETQFKDPNAIYLPQVFSIALGPEARIRLIPVLNKLINEINKEFKNL